MISLAIGHLLIGLSFRNEYNNVEFVVAAGVRAIIFLLTNVLYTLNTCC